MRNLLCLSPRRCWRGLALLLTGALLWTMVPESAEAQRARPRRPAAAASRGKASAKKVTARKPRASAGAARGKKRGSAVRAGRAGRRDRTVRGRRGRRAALVATPIVPRVAKATVVTDSAPALRDSVVSLARQQLGTAYILGAEKPGSAFDCSGLVKYVMSWINVRLPRTANEQAYTGINVGRQLDRMKPGDLLTFGKGRRITHIGVYVGDGKYVHASRPGVGVIESVLNPNARRFRGAVRVVADASDTAAVAMP
jgi:cell wall-associated NlpC family hydrolase